MCSRIAPCIINSLYLLCSKARPKTIIHLSFNPGGGIKGGSGPDRRTDACARRVGASKGGGPQGGALRVARRGPNQEKVGARRVGGGPEVGPEGWGGQRFALFFFFPPQISFFHLSLGGLPSGIVAAVRGCGPPKVRVWASLGSFVRAPAACPRHFGWATASNRGHNSTGKTTRERDERTKFAAEKGKRAKFWSVGGGGSSGGGSRGGGSSGRVSRRHKKSHHTQKTKKHTTKTNTQKHRQKTNETHTHTHKNTQNKHTQHTRHQQHTIHTTHNNT